MSVLDQYMRPRLMSLGDSLYQGVRSLTLDRNSTRVSVPLQISKALGMDNFRYPKPRYPVFFALDAWLRSYPNVIEINDSLKEMMGYWRRVPVQEVDCPVNDNLAITSYRYNHITDMTARSASDWLKENITEAEWNKTTSIFGLISLTRDPSFLPKLETMVRTLSTIMTYNPLQLDELYDMTAIDQVAYRKPKSLIVNIGSNNGFFKALFNGDRTPVDLNGLPELAEQLASLPRDIEHIYFNNLAKPSAVANLMPPGALDSFVNAPLNKYGYFVDGYETRCGFGYRLFSADEMRALDQHIEYINKNISDVLLTAFGDDERLHIVDMYKMLARTDSKHNYTSSPNKIKLDNGMLLSNASIMLDNDSVDSNSLKYGGLFSLDGMHPTGCGYALMANEVLAAMQKYEKASIVNPIDYTEAAAQDSLLSDLPKHWNRIITDYRNYRRRAVEARGDVGFISEIKDDFLSMMSILNAIMA